MKCPVCKTECGEANKCHTCGFDQLNVEFLNKEDAAQWKREILLPFIKQQVCDPDDFLIEDGILKDFSGEKPIVIIPNNITLFRIIN